MNISNGLSTMVTIDPIHIQATDRNFYFLCDMDMSFYLKTKENKERRICSATRKLSAKL